MPFHLPFPFPLTLYPFPLRFVNRSAAGRCTTDAPFFVGMKRVFVVDRNLFAGFYVAQGDEEDMTVENFHESVRLTGMIDVMGAVAVATAVETPPIVDSADAQLASTCPAIGFRVSDLLASVLCNLSAALEMGHCKTTLAHDRRFLDCQTLSEC